MAETSEDQALQAWLLRARLADEGGPGLAERTSAGTDVDDGLRRLGYNYKERAALRRGSKVSVDKSRYNDTVVKQFKFHIQKRIAGRVSIPDCSKLAGVWAALTKYDLYLSTRLWDTGFDPAAPDQFDAFLTAGLGLADLEVVVDRKTIAAHLREGQPVKWCIAAILWARDHP